MVAWPVSKTEIIHFHEPDLFTAFCVLSVISKLRDLNRNSDTKLWILLYHVMLSDFVQADLLGGECAVGTPADEIHSLAIAQPYTEASFPALFLRGAVAVQIS